MFSNYLKTAIRNLLKHKGYSFINITGLAVGMACCILIMALIIDELSFDLFHENQANIYRVATVGKIAGRTIEIATVPAPFGPTLVKDYPEVLNAVRFRDYGRNVFSYGDRKFYETGLYLTDNSIFDIFSFKLLRGDPATALKAPYSIVINQEIAEKYFDAEDPIGKILKVKNDKEFFITGIIADPPPNSHIQFRMLASFETYYAENPDRMVWYNWNYQTYIQLDPNTAYREFEQKFVDFNERYIGDFVRSIGGDISNYLQPLTSIHLYSNIEGEISPGSDIKYVYAFGTIAIFILFVACINFMNLSTARSARRAREVGLRKVFGAQRKALIYQFLGESLLLAVISMAFSLVIVKLASPFFNNLAGREIPLNLFTNPIIIAGLVIIVLFIGLVAGSYPAFFLSSFKPIRVLKGQLQKGANKSKLRSGLVVFQFAISIMLVIGTSIVLNQLHYMRSKNPGFDKQQILVLSLNDDSMRQKTALIKTEMSTIDGVISVAGSMKVPGEESFNTSVFYPEGFSANQSVLMENFNIDLNFLETYNIALIDDRNFSNEFTTDEDAAILINEMAAKALEWENPVGKIIYQPTSSDDMTDRQALTVIGVINDIHHRSLQHAVEPALINLNTESSSRISLRLAEGTIPETIKQVEQHWNAIFPDQPFDYFFLDDYFDGLYRSEEQLGNIFKTFTIFAILIGCLGLLGLASYAAEQRTKEIGIRKVLGSSATAVVLMLWKEFLVLVLVANLFAWPVAYFTMNNWLQSFPYQAGMPVVIFIAAAIAAIIIALLTVSYQSIKAALANPVKSLRYE